MCGIAGLWASPPNVSLESSVRAMVDTLEHRGPDGVGSWCEPAAGVALGHRRLSIIDVSAAGHQPMHAASGNLVMSYNGEVYNFKELQRSLEREGSCPQLAGGSDTEVLLAAIEAWGLEEAVSRFNGMFALAVWDRCKQTLTLARDCVGIKPLYYGWTKSAFIFGSELKALTAYPDFDPTLDMDALSGFLRSGNIAAPRSIYRDVLKLEPGHTITFTSPHDRGAVPSQYWSLPRIIANVAPFDGTAHSAIDHLEELLFSAVEQRMVSDVPLGAFLSGGIDSSLVVAMMQGLSPQPVRTFSVGFNESAFNEAKDAQQIASHLGTHHTELYVSPEDAQAVIPNLANIYDEPFADSSQIPTLLVSAMTREHVTVALSGDGGDELFAGYDAYTRVPRLWAVNRAMPRLVRRGLARGLESRSPEQWNHTYNRLTSALPRRIRGRSPGGRMQKLADSLKHNELDEFYNAFTSAWPQPCDLLRCERDHKRPLPLMHGRSIQERMMLRDALDYLPNDILTKVDRASMNQSLEVRVPILDHRVIEFAWSLPHRFKVQDNVRKWILREVLYRHVPQAMMDRPKMGFSVPIGDWLRGPLRDWAESLIGASELTTQGVLNAAPIRKAWEQHLDGINRQAPLWYVLMLQAWLREHPYTIP